MKLFDLQVQPALTYTAEVWGSTKVKEIERVHMYACKKALSVSQKTPNAMIYGELGRYPLFVRKYVHESREILVKINGTTIEQVR